MAVILKKPDVNTSKTRRVCYADLDGHNSDGDVIDSGQPTIESIKDTEPVLFEPHSESSDNDSARIPEVTIIDGKLSYQGKDYYSHEFLDKLVEERVAQHLKKIQNEKQDILNKAKEDGYVDGQNIAKTEHQERFSQLCTLIESIEKALAEKVDENIELIKNVVFISLVKILGDSLRNDSERINIIKNVIQQTASNNPFVLRLSSHDYELLSSGSDYSTSLGSIEIRSDNRVDIGGCIIDTDKGTFDGRLEIQLAILKEAIDSE